MEKLDLIDSHEAQKILFFWSAKTIQKYASDGKLPSVKLGGRTFYRESELRKLVSLFIEERETKSKK